jgi:hypothetical protein
MQLWEVSETRIREGLKKEQEKVPPQLQKKRGVIDLNAIWRPSH